MSGGRVKRGFVWIVKRDHVDWLVGWFWLVGDCLW